MEPLEQTLAQHPFLAGLDSRYLRQLACFASGKQFKPLQMIFYEGDDAKQFYLIREGKVAIEMPMLGCDAIQIQVLGPGDALGWSWLLPPYHWHFSARAVEPTQVIALDGQALRAKCEADHHLGYEVLKRFAQVVVQRLEATRTRVLNLPGAEPASEGPLVRHFAELDE
jgi:CRP-like cAMP-binding protein